MAIRFGVRLLIAASCIVPDYLRRIFPARIRDAGVAVGVASQWLFSFVYTLSNAYMIASMGW